MSDQILIDELLLKCHPGICCGSTSIDESFKAWVTENWPQPGAFCQTASNMGLTEDSILNTVLAQFEDHKKSFPQPPAGGQKGVFVKGKRGEVKEVCFS